MQHEALAVWVAQIKAAWQTSIPSASYRKFLRLSKNAARSKKTISNTLLSAAITPQEPNEVTLPAWRLSMQDGCTAAAPLSITFAAQAWYQPSSPLTASAAEHMTWWWLEV